MDQMVHNKNYLKAKDTLNHISWISGDKPDLFIQDRKTSWNEYINDVKNAKHSIDIDIPDAIFDYDEMVEDLTKTLQRCALSGVKVGIRLPENVSLPIGLQKYSRVERFVINPISLIDKKIVWFGHPLYDAEFISEGEILESPFGG